MILVRHILENARKRLVALGQEASIAEAAALLANPHTPLVVVCDNDGIAVGVVTKSNVIKAFAESKEAAAKMSAGDVMTRAVLSCHIDQTLQRVWGAMISRSVRSAPVVDDSGRPLGVVHARDVATALLNEVDEEEVLLCDYFLGVGYQ